MQTPTGDGIAYPDPNYIDFTRTTVPRRPILLTLCDTDTPLLQKCRRPCCQV